MAKLSKEKLASLLKSSRGEESMRSFARRIGVALASLQGWENEAAIPSTQNLERIALACRMTFPDLMQYLGGYTTAKQTESSALVDQIKYLSDKEFAGIVVAVAERMLQKAG